VINAVLKSALVLGSAGLGLLAGPSRLFSQSGSAETLPRFTSFEEAKPTLDEYRYSGLSGTGSSERSEWDRWIRGQDADVRSRIDRGVEDSVSNFILYGTSYTKLPRLSGTDEALEPSGEISPAARKRILALVTALTGSRGSERLEFIKRFLVEKRIAREQFSDYLAANLVRFAGEQRAYQRTLEHAGKAGDANEVLAVRGTLYEKRGLSVDTSLLPNFAIEETLRALVDKSVLKRASVSRIVIIGPGLDFTDKRDGYDFYPLQTIQPFAVLETLKRLHLAEGQLVRVVTFDLNAAVNAHMAQLSQRARNEQGYIIQLPRDTSAAWTTAAVSYWKHFGDYLGSSVRPLPVPDALPTIESRAIAVRPEYAASMTPLDLNIVAQTIDVPESSAFDLVIATNVLVYYDVFQQSLAMGNIAQILKPGGIFLANNSLPVAHDKRLKYLGRKQVVFAQDGSYGDDIVVYQRQAISEP
jgi:hypothetical protein